MVSDYALFLPLCADMGVQLFLDTVRTLKPTHIIRCLPHFRQSVDYVCTLPPLTAEYMSTTPGGSRGQSDPLPTPLGGSLSLGTFQVSLAWLDPHNP